MGARIAGIKELAERDLEIPDWLCGGDSEITTDLFRCFGNRSAVIRGMLSGRVMGEAVIFWRIIMPDQDRDKDVSSGRVGGDNLFGTARTGADLTSEGSSAEVDSDVATAEDIPSTEEILEMGEEGTGHRPYRYPAPPHAPTGGTIGGAAAPEPEEENIPHDKGRMQDIE